MGLLDEFGRKKEEEGEEEENLLLFNLCKALFLEAEAFVNVIVKYLEEDEKGNELYSKLGWCLFV